MLTPENEGGSNDDYCVAVHKDTYVNGFYAMLGIPNECRHCCIVDCIANQCPAINRRMGNVMRTQFRETLTPPETVM